MKKKILIPIIIFIVFIVTFFVVRLISERRDLEANPYRIAFIRMKEGGQFWGSMRNGAREARTDTQTSVDFFSTVNASDIDMQIEFVNKAIEKKVDAIVITPSDTKALIEPLNLAANDGIKIIQLFNEVSQSDNSKFYSVMTNTKAIGVEIANKIINKSNNRKLNVLLVSRSINVSSSKYIEEGIMETLKKVDNINCNSLYAGSNIDLIKTRIENYINNYQTINYIVALDDDTSEGISKYLNSKTSNNDIYFMATSHSLANIQNLEKGIIDELLILNSFAMGYQGVYAANEILKGNNLNNQKIDYIFVNKENMFDENVQRKLFILY
ncbi:MAG: sugar ABC transporter substrate-binding protein [Spirochaetia bacterium]|nr:sugar ABC transporter substrate-binding protein [Spirochaetia bacterium]